MMAKRLFFKQARKLDFCEFYLLHLVAIWYKNNIWQSEPEGFDFQILFLYLTNSIKSNNIVICIMFSE